MAMGGRGVAQDGVKRDGNGRVGEQLVRLAAKRLPDLVLELWHVAAIPAASSKNS